MVVLLRSSLAVSKLEGLRGSQVKLPWSPAKVEERQQAQEQNSSVSERPEA